MKSTKKNNSPKIITDDGTEMEITPRGSLALLAFGAVGLDVWRQVRMQYVEDEIINKNKTSNDKK